ncbi:MAG: hypothetical protein ABWZ25_18050 [Chitinophagaceae bacterium]
MQKTLRTLLATFIAFVFSVVLSYFIEDLSRRELGFGQYIARGLIYGLPVLGIGTIIFIIINYLTQIRISRRNLKNAHLYYFGLSFSFALIPALGFSLFDFVDRGRFFNNPTFGEIFIKYLPSIWLVGIGAVFNWLLVWKRFVNKF